MTPLTPEIREKGIHEVFVISILLKGVAALSETILGFLLLYSNDVLDLIIALVQDELIDDPNDFFASHLQPLLAHTASPETLRFGALYLLSHGIVKLVLVGGLLRDKLWAYPASLAVFTLFIAYQLVRYVHTYSVWLLALTVFDLVVMWLIWHEYRLLQKRAA